MRTHRRQPDAADRRQMETGAASGSFSGLSGIKEGSINLKRPESPVISPVRISQSDLILKPLP